MLVTNICFFSSNVVYCYTNSITCATFNLSANAFKEDQSNTLQSGKGLTQLEFGYKLGRFCFCSNTKYPAVFLAENILSPGKEYP